MGIDVYTSEHVKSCCCWILKLLLILHNLSLCDTEEWRSISACTTQGLNTMSVDCLADIIQIGRSHYGVKQLENTMERCQPNLTDCTMDYTGKISDQCNGLSRCNVNLLAQFIHKCDKTASYFFLTYRCVKASSLIDVCEKIREQSKDVQIISPAFPYNYPANSDCTCILMKPQKTVMLLETINFQVHEPDKVGIFYDDGEDVHLPLSLSNKTAVLDTEHPVSLRFTSDSSLSKPGFWYRFSAYPVCSPEWRLLDNKCVRVIKHNLPWHMANSKCSRMGGHLVTIKDTARDVLVSKVMRSDGLNEKDSLWIGLRWVSEEGKLVWVDGVDEVWKGNAIWPWDRSVSIVKENGNKSHESACVSRSGGRWLLEDCSLPKYFICEQELSRVRQKVDISCGPSSNFSLSIISRHSDRSRNLSMSRHTLLAAAAEPHWHSAPGGFFGSDGQSSNNRSNMVGLGLTLIFLISVLVALLICNVVMFILCRRRHYDDTDSVTEISSGCTSCLYRYIFSTNQSRQHGQQVKPKLVNKVYPAPRTSISLLGPIYRHHSNLPPSPQRQFSHSYHSSPSSPIQSDHHLRPNHHNQYSLYQHQLQQCCYCCSYPPQHFTNNSDHSPDSLPTAMMVRGYDDGRCCHGNTDNNNISTMSHFYERVIGRHNDPMLSSSAYTIMHASTPRRSCSKLRHGKAPSLQQSSPRTPHLHHNCHDRDVNNSGNTELQPNQPLQPTLPDMSDPNGITMTEAAHQSTVDELLFNTLSRCPPPENCNDDDDDYDGS